MKKYLVGLADRVRKIRGATIGRPKTAYLKFLL